MVPPPGHAAEFAFDRLGVDVHILGGVRAGDYSGRLQDHLAFRRRRSPNSRSSPPRSSSGARLATPATTGSAGDMRMPAHRTRRPGRRELPGDPHRQAPAQPADLLHEIDADDAQADFWESLGRTSRTTSPPDRRRRQPDPGRRLRPAALRPRVSKPVPPPTRPTPRAASADLHIPQTDDVGELATAHLRKAVVALPEGMSLNPSSANGLDACDPGEVGIDKATGIANGNQPSCPEASRIGSVEVDTPLLDHALPGSVYVATPHDNPFDSLLGDLRRRRRPDLGHADQARRPGRTEPEYGRLVTTFDNNPQLPFTDFKLNFFGGPGGCCAPPRPAAPTPPPRR